MIIIKTMEHEDNGDTICKRCTWKNSQRFGKGWRVRNQKTSHDYPNYSIVEIDQNTEESPGDLQRLAVTQTPSLKLLFSNILYVLILMDTMRMG